MFEFGTQIVVWNYNVSDKGNIVYGVNAILFSNIKQCFIFSYSWQPA